MCNLAGHKDENGFTMIELMVVVLILSVLVSLAMFAISALDENADQAIDDANTKQCSSALAAYSVEYGSDATGWSDIAPYFEPGTTDPGCGY
jgi:prepilin-type N-terminal cleavage/methylation domain-containing protein